MDARRAWTISAIVAYGRPFSRNAGIDAAVQSQLAAANERLKARGQTTLSF